MTKQELIERIRKNGVLGIQQMLTHKEPNLYKQVLEDTAFLDDSQGTFSERLYCIVNDLIERPKCTVCSKDAKFYKYTQGYSRTCSTKCSYKDPEKVQRCQETCMERYGNISATGTEGYTEKVKKTCMKRYGTEHHLSKGSEVRERVEQTNAQRYGGISPFCASTVQENYRNSLLEKYGVDNPLKIPEVRDRVTRSSMKNHYRTVQSFKRSMPLFTEDEYLNTGFGYDNMYRWKCKRCESEFDSYYANGNEPLCPTCFPKYRSIGEHEIAEYIRSLGFDIQTNKKHLIGDELDIIIPEKKIAIEYNGNFYHSEASSKDRSYHLSKTNKTEALGWRLIHIFEDEWLYKKDIIKTKLRHLLGKCKRSIFARECIVRTIDSRTKDKFLEKYHIQGKDRSVHKYGLYHKNRLVAVMTFCKLRKVLGHRCNDGWELSRFATIGSFNVVGAAGKLLKHFLRNEDCTKLISYADRRFTTAVSNVYEKLGFRLDHVSPPNYWYFVNGNFHERHSRLKFQKHMLKDMLDTFDENLTEYQNMQANGNTRIWDCGNFVYVLHR